MPDTYLGENRFLFVETPLGADKLLISAFSGKEAISEPFHFRLDLVSEDARIKFEDIIGKKVTFGVTGEQATERREINGVVLSFTQLPTNHRIARYQAVVVPQMWLLKYQHDCRIFQDQAVPDILKTVFSGLEVEYSLTGSYSPREYCVQYRESDFDFASRLMEEEGIFYFFKHSANSHKLVLADANSAHADLAGDARLLFDDMQSIAREEEAIYAWEKTQSISSAKVALRDYGFKKPAASTDANEGVLGSPVAVGTVYHPLDKMGNADLEMYDFPGGYSRDGGYESGKGSHAAKLLAEGLECSQFNIRGESDIYRLEPGFKFNLTRHFNANGQYVLTSVTHHGTEGDIYSQSNGEQPSYRNQFGCLPFGGLTYRPARVTPRPRMYGCQTATVTGKSGEEIWTDEYGRIKVHFHWNREDKSDEKSSCWLRVATPWAGNLWGMIHIPRIGQEVVVDFVEGDPDRPLVVGSVYNAANMPPWALPGEKTKSGIKSKSTLKGESKNYNQILFEDKKGSELVQIQAEKDMELLVKNDRKEEIDNDTHLTVKRDQIDEIKRDRSFKIGRDVLGEVARDYNLKVTGKRAEQVDSSYSLKVGSSAAEKIGTSYAMDAGQSIYLKGGMNVVIEAGMMITLKAGGGFIVVGPAGVTISGTPVLINSGGSAGSGTAGNIVAPAAIKMPALPGTGAVDGSGTSGSGSGSSGSGGAGGSGSGGAGAAASSAPSHDPNDEKNKDKKHFVSFQLNDDAGKPLAGVAYEVILPDKSVASGTTDEKGEVMITNLDSGNCDITFPGMDEEAWEEG